MGGGLFYDIGKFLDKLLGIKLGCFSEVLSVSKLWQISQRIFAERRPIVRDANTKHHFLVTGRGVYLNDMGPLL